jgi:hypothetical protein
MLSRVHRIVREKISTQPNIPKLLTPGDGDYDGDEERDAGKFVTLSFARVSSLSTLSPQCHFRSKMALRWAYSVSHFSPS